jgi:dihydroxyacetone kinase
MFMCESAGQGVAWNEVIVCSSFPMLESNTARAHTQLREATQLIKAKVEARARKLGLLAEGQAHVGASSGGDAEHPPSHTSGSGIVDVKQEENSCEDCQNVTDPLAIKAEPGALHVR